MNTNKEAEKVDGNGVDPQITEKENPNKSKKSGRKANKTQEKIDELTADLNQAKDKYLRLYAEFENYKKRTIKERIDLMNTAAQGTLSSLLPVLDDFDRAKKSADDESTEEVFSEGVNLVYNKLHTVIQVKGLKVMETNGEDFNPEFHEAITEIPAPTKNLKGKIIDTIEKGYLLNDKIIRHAKVVVGK